MEQLFKVNLSDISLSIRVNCSLPFYKISLQGVLDLINRHTQFY